MVLAEEGAVVVVRRRDGGLGRMGWDAFGFSVALSGRERHVVNVE